MDRVVFEKAFYHHLPTFLDLLRIPSIYDEKTITPTTPYGKDIKRAFDYMKLLCIESGFDVQEYNHKVFSASYGSGERIDIASHLDVVSVNDGWNHPPFAGEMDETYIYGRGAQDMKSGAWLVYLALKMICEQGIQLNKEIRLVYGSDEERTMEDMKEYLSLVPKPAFSFSPDGSFPMAIGEKGALMWQMCLPYQGIMKEMDCGTQPNMVSPCATATINAQNEQEVRTYFDTHGIQGKVCVQANEMVISIVGKSSHASRPQGSVDATLLLLKLLSDIYHEKEMGRLYQFFSDYHGRNGNLFYDIPPMGKLTVVLGKLTLKDGKLVGLVDCRYPYGVCSDVLTTTLKSAFKDWQITKPYDDIPTLMQESDPHIQALLKAYRKVCPDEVSEPFILGGVSYAKVFGNCVCFGPVKSSSVDYAHQRDERILIQDCIDALAIYYNSILSLAEVEDMK